MLSSGLRHATLPGLLRHRAGERPQRDAFIFLADGEDEGARLTWSDLDGRARAIALALRASLASGDRALLLYPPGLDFIAAFFGCLYAGVVAVPAYPPRPNDRVQDRLHAIARDAEPRAALTTSAILAGIEASPAVPELAALRWIATEGLGRADADLPEPDPESLALLQYTSGSTATPKGVMVTHANLLHNERMIGEAFAQDEDSVVVGWLPLYHDMGLIGNVLQPLHSGGRCVLMAPVAFLQRPLRWLAAISHYRATTSGGPNFAYDLCVRRIGPEDREGLDLSSWRVAFNGAEPVRADTLERFAAAFAPCGFRPEAFYPCYGLAEATLFVSGGAADRAPRTVEMEGSPRVSCGHAWGEQRIAIVDPESGIELAPGRVGETWIAGPSVARGYWRNPEGTQRNFRARLADTGEGPFLRTGDLGAVRGGELYVTGRIKDLVILRGRNHYPQDLELTAERSHPDLRPGGGAAFSIEVGSEERLVVVQEVERRRRDSFEELALAIRRAIAEEHEAQAHEVVLVRAGTVPKTSSGKVQRRLCRELYLSGGLTVLGRSAVAEGAETGPALMREDLAGADPALLERFLRERAAAALGVRAEDIDPRQPLTAYGLDSLAALELKGAVEPALGVELPLAEILEGAGIERLAEVLTRTDTDQHGRTRTEGAGPWPSALLSYGERALWFLHRLAPEAGAYNIAVAARARGLDSEGLRRTLEDLAVRHPAFRTVFPADEGQPRRQVLERPAIDWLEEKETGWSGARLQERLAAEAWRPFSLERGPLVRVRIFHRGDAEPVLLFVVHHIVADFASLAIVVRDLTGAGAPPPPSTGFAAWQSEMLAGPRGERLWDFWRGMLAGVRGPVPDLDLPTDRPRPPVQTWRGVARALELPPALADGVRTLAAGQGATVYTVLLSALMAQLGRASGQRDFAVGAPAASRGAPEQAGLVGYLVNPVVLRADLEGDPGFSGLLGRMRRTVLDGLAHGDFPFPLLAERLRPVRDPARAPLFQAMFLLQRTRPGAPPGLAVFSLGESGGRIPLGSAELESLRIEERRTQLDLTLRAAELTSGALGLSLEVNADLFDAATAARMLGHFQTLLAGAVAAPDRPLSQLPWLTPVERSQVLAEWSAGPAAAPRSLLLHQPFEEQAARTPDAEALVAGTGRLTYAELNRRANRLAHHLRRLGVGPEVRVGVRLGRTPDLVVSLLAVLKAGGAYVPLDPAYPEERLALMREDSGAKLVLTRGDRGVKVDWHRTDPTDLTDPTDDRSDPTDRSDPSDANPPPLALPRNLAYLVYTSGSTGRPKAVGIEHRSAAVLVHWARGAFTPAELSGVLASTSAAFDLSVFELFAPLSWGGRVILAENALELPWLPAASEVTLVNTVPSALAELVRGGLPPSVCTINLGGELAPAALAEALLAVPGVERVYNIYGPSEDTVYSTLSRLAPGNGVPIGRPIDGARAYVLDARLDPVPAGVPGELYLGGEGLARGYLGRPELTAERFLPDPFGSTPGARLYRTGDLSRWRSDGELDFLGRMDHQVKVRGFRIELGEIEAALASLPGVREAVALAVGDSASERSLAAFLVPETGGGLPDEELRDGLRRTLPEHMIPSCFVFLEKFPLSPNGKVDRRALARLGTGAEDASGREPRTPAEARLCELFAELLERPRVSIHDNFFDLGGHSLLATRLAARIERDFGIDLPVSALFTAPTVARLAGLLSGETAAPAPPPVPRRERSVREQPYAAPRTPLEQRLVDLWASALGRERVGLDDDFFDLGGHSLLGARLMLEARQSFGVDLPLAELFDARTPRVLAERLEAAGGWVRQAPVEWPEPPDGAVVAPLAFAQRRLWLLHQLDPGSAAYHVPGVLTLAGTLRPEVLAAALDEIVRRHDALRTVFAVRQGEPVQVVLPPDPPGARPLPLVDLTALPAGRREAEASALAGAEARRPFDLAAGPLLRTLLLRTTVAEHRLALVMHHIVADGWSLGVLRAELAALVAAFAAGRPSPLPPLPVQLPDVAVAQHRELRRDILERQLAHWQDRLAGAPALELPTDRPRPALLSDRGATVPVALPPGLTRGLQDLARREGATLFMALLAAWAALLGRHSGQDDLTVGTPVAGRDRPEVELLIGCFMNTLPLRVRLDGDPPFSTLLHRVREVTLAAYDHQEVPFDRLVEALAPERGRGQTPLYQVLLTLQNAPQPPLSLPGLELSLAEIPTGTTWSDLGLLLAGGEEGLAGVLEYRADLFEAATIERIAAHLMELLAGAVRAPEQRLSDLPLLTAAERQQILGEWSFRDVPYPQATIHGLFEEQAALRPEAPAVEQGEERLTYGELNARADRLAHRLRRLGVGPESRVGLLLERSLELVVGMLAVLKAGGAYVPLDPAEPPERLEMMLRDAGARVVLTRGELVEHRTDPTDQTDPTDYQSDRSDRSDRSDPSDARPTVLPDSLAYVIYTSGSTGLPKGVEVPHRGVVRLVRPEGESGHARGGPGEVFLHAASPQFDAATLEVWGPLLTGGRLVVLPGRVPALSELGRAIARHGVTTLWLTAGLFHLIVEERLDDLRPLRCLLAGGDVIQPGHLRRAQAGLPGCRLINGYGPTENTTFTAAWEAPGKGDPGGPVPIGRPVAATRVYLLDRWFRPVPAGVPGELCTGGAGLARGYLSRPELTAERFVPDPFGQGERLYRTGDLARWRPDGNLEFLGRLDRQVKIRGFRIEPGEVETVLAGHPEVAAAAVLVREDLPGGRGLVAFVVPRPGSSPLEAALRAHLRDRLPAAMMPALFRELPALPLTPNGKVDRRALARLSAAPPAVTVESFEPILPVPRSADAALPLSFAQERLWVLDRLQGGSPVYNMPLELRLRGTVAVPELAAALAGVVRRHETLRTRFAGGSGEPVQVIDPPAPTRPHPLGPPLPSPPPPPGEGEAPARSLTNIRSRDLPLSRLAGGRWERGTEGVRSTEVPSLWDFDAALDWPLPLVDLAALPAEAREEEARHLAKEEARRPFQLDTGPLLRIALLRLDAAEHRLVLNLHHIATDGWSMGLLLAEIREIYGALCRRVPPRLPDLPVQYADFAVWQRRRLTGEVLERETAWWRERLRGLPPLDLPTDRPRPAVPSFRGGEVPVTLGPDLPRELAALARREGATPFMVLLAGWAALLAGWSGQCDLAVGGPVASRTRPEIESLIGFFVNSLVLRCDLTGDPDFLTLLGRARQTVLDAHAHQELPFEKLVDALQPRRDLSRAPLFQVMLALDAFSLPPLELNGVSLEPEPVPTGTSRVDLTLHLTQGDDGFTGRLEYAADLFDEATALRLAEGLCALLAAAAAGPGLSLEHLVQATPLPPAAERQILADAEPLSPEAPAAYAPPQSELERTLCAAWSEVLGRERVGVRESFFEIGGNSLALVRLHSRLEQILGREMPITALFRHPTIESLAQEIAGQAPEPAMESEAAADARERTELRRASLRQLQRTRGNLRGRRLSEAEADVEERP